MRRFVNPESHADSPFPTNPIAKDRYNLRGKVRSNNPKPCCFQLIRSQRIGTTMFAFDGAAKPLTFPTNPIAKDRYNLATVYAFRHKNTSFQLIRSQRIGTTASQITAIGTFHGNAFPTNPIAKDRYNLRRSCELGSDRYAFVSN